jgi:imidazolonepropionase
MKPEKTDCVGLIENGYIYAEDGVIKAVGSMDQFKNDVFALGPADEIDAAGKIVLPGFVDCHTHSVFGGSRVAEYSIKLTDNDPAALEKLGIEAGMYGTVNATKNLPAELLEEQSFKRVSGMLSNGTTTIEIKSGYGLSTDSEIKMLEIIKRLNKRLPLDIHSTFLGAHGWPKDMSKEKYIDVLTKDMIPKVSELKLAQFCDVWCDDGYYTAKESEKILSCGRDYGLIPKIHTDCYSYIGGSDLAADMHMISADHLNYTPENVFKKLRGANVVGVVAPGTDFAVKHPKPFDPRPMLEAGMDLAIATNCNPGVWVESMQVILVLACRQHGFTPAEAVKAATKGGALALGLNDVGILDAGKKADIQIWDLDTYEDIIYKFGAKYIKTVIKDGNIVVNN